MNSPSLSRRAFMASSTLLAWNLTRGNIHGGLQAGAAELKVTPAAKGTFLIGPMKPSEGVHDDLYARALVLGNDQQRLTIVPLDYLGFDFAFYDLDCGNQQGDWHPGGPFAHCLQP